MRDRPHTSSLARPRAPAGVMSRAATVAMVMPLVVLLLALATPASALELQHMEETLKSHTHTLAMMTKYLRMTDKFWNWFRNNRVLLDELLNAGVQTRALDSPQLHELNEKILDVETKLEGSHNEVTGRLTLDLSRLEQELENERNNSRVLKQELEESKQKTEELEEKLMKIEGSSKVLVMFANQQIMQVNNDLKAVKAIVQEVKDKQSELDVVENKVEDHERRISHWEAEGNVTKSGWAGAILRQVEDSVAPLRLALDAVTNDTAKKVEDHERRISHWEAEGNVTKSGWAGAILRQVEDTVAPLRLALDLLNDTLTNDTAKKVEDHERRISHWEAEGNVTKNGWAGAILRQVEDTVASLRLDIDLLNATTTSLGNATTKAKEDIQEMEQEREIDREYVRILEEALEGMSSEVDELATRLVQVFTESLFPMNDSISLNGDDIRALQNATRSLRDELTERLEEVEKNVKYKGSTGSAKTSHFQKQLTLLRSATTDLAANISSLESQLASVRDSEAQLEKDVQALQQQSGQVDLDLSALEAKVGSAANLTARVKSLEKRMARRDATLTTGNKLLSSLASGGSMLNAPGGKAPVTFLKNPGQIGFPMGSGPSNPAGVAPSNVTPPSGALSGSTGLAGLPASANSVIAGTNNLMPVTHSGASGGRSTTNPPRSTVSPGLVGNTGAASSPGTTGGLGTTVNAIVTSTPRPAGNASVTSISGTTVNPGTAGNTNVTSIPGVASSPGTAVVPRTAGNTSITSTPAPASNPGATGNTSVTSTPGAAGSASTASTTGGTSSPGAASNPGVTGKPGTSGSPATAGNRGAVGNTSVASNPVAAAHPGAARGLGASGNSGSAGKPGAFGNNGRGGSMAAAGARARGMSAGRSVGP
ncbi:uncharacterized protein LOC125039738 [Penaeus chinensis]|uniref:uncharacterized protein LOC125039738 n=1 Tax=Penaeus chinensis TaxID=139456 RepID=UPI001FB6E307|nr:uncharacterized protein LOC125039738 [Penaeus chinensis]